MSAAKHLQFLKRGMTKALNILPRTPLFAQIEITNLCNLECRLCVRRFLKDLEFRHIDYALFQKIVDRLGPVPVIGLTGFGEPLMYPRIFDAIEYCKSKGHEVQFTSNGLLLNNDETINRIINSGIDCITFSIDSLVPTEHPLHNNIKTLANIERIGEIKKRRNVGIPRIAIQSVMVKGQEDGLLALIKWASQREIFRVNISRLNRNTSGQEMRLSVSEEKQLFKRFDNLRKTTGVRIDCVQDQFYDGLKGYAFKYFKYLLSLNSNCTRLQDFVYIDVNGNTRPCCALTQFNMGNLLEEDLERIWHGTRYSAFRKNFQNYEWCAKCDILSLKQVTS